MWTVPWLRIFSCSICKDPAGLAAVLVQLIRWLGLMGVSSRASQRDVPRLFRGVSVISWDWRVCAWSCCCHGKIEDPAWRRAMSLWFTLAEDWFNSYKRKKFAKCTLHTRLSVIMTDILLTLTCRTLSSFSSFLLSSTSRLYFSWRSSSLLSAANVQV